MVSVVDKLAVTARTYVRRRLLLIGAAVFVLLVLGLVTLRLWVLTPDVTDADRIEPADAVVIFVGGRGEREAMARQLMAAGVADTLVVPNGEVIGRMRDQCGLSLGYEVLCPPSMSLDTGGEAKAIAELARERGWERLIMVTSDYHIARARLRLERCFDGEVEAVAADNWATRPGRAYAFAREYLGHVEARTIERSC